MKNVTSHKLSFDTRMLLGVGSGLHAGKRPCFQGLSTVFQSSTSSENLFGHENPEVASLYRVTQFELNFLGMIQEVNLSGIQTRDPDVQLIDKVEESQVSSVWNDPVVS